MELSPSAAVSSIESCFREANIAFLNYCYRHQQDPDNGYDGVACRLVEKGFIQMLNLLEHFELTSEHKTVQTMYETAKKGNLIENRLGQEEPYLVWIKRLQMHLDIVIATFDLNHRAHTELLKLKDVISRTIYSICDTKLFENVPNTEADVHHRIEALLKPQYPDLRRKPKINKTIKNFEPDSGIYSIKTLIEYKFVNNISDVKRVVDEILADTRGYASTKWKNILFVIYETRRITPEDEWNMLFRECGLNSNFEALVLHGDAN